MGHEILSGLAGVVYVLGTVPYLYKIYQREDRPSISSWLIWTLLDGITLTGMIFERQVNGLIIAAVACSLLTTTFAAWRGSWEWDRKDTACLIGAILGILIWKIASSATLAIATCAIVNLIGGYPTVKRAWEEPQRENSFTWTCYWVSCVLTLLSLREWSLASASQPVSFTVVETMMLYVVWFRPRSRV